MIYDAFISYRHTPLDMEFAKKVHSGLETYRVPKAVQKKTGKKKIKRVFRDQEELPIGSDLNDNISAALRESEYLVVICSPETPGSYWVSKEIETFIAMHGRRNILAVLIDGEPEQSFPEQLLTDENGHPVEPLAADVRGATAAERNKKFKTELLRLAAPILGCTYDDLRQRHRERILKRNLLIGATAAGILAVAGAAFGIYNAGVAKRMKKLADSNEKLANEKSLLADEKTLLADEKTKLADEKTKLADEILAEYREKQRNQSQFYAEEAMLLLREGNREDAVLVAAAGLPGAGDDRPFVPEAEYALSAALHAYDCGNELDYDRILKHELVVSSMTPDREGKYLTTIDSGYTVFVWDCETWELLLQIAPSVSDSNFRIRVISAYASENGVMVLTEKSLVRYDFTGKETSRVDFNTAVKGWKVYESRDLIFCSSFENLYVLSFSGLNEKAAVPCEEGSRFGTDGSISRDGSMFAIDRVVPDGQNGGIMLVSMDSFDTVSCSATNEYVLNLAVTDNGNIAAVSTNGDFYYTEVRELALDVFDAQGTLLYSREIPADVYNLSGFELLIDSHSYDGKCDIVIALDDKMFSYDEESGEKKAAVTLPATAVMLDLSTNSGSSFISLNNGDIVSINSDNGRFYSESTVSTGINLEDMQIINGGILVRSPASGDIAVLKLHTASDLKELPELPADEIGYAVAPTSEYYVLNDRYKYNALRFFDINGTLLYSLNDGKDEKAVGFLGNTCIVARFESLLYINPITGSMKEVTYESMGAEPSYTKAVFSADGSYLALWGTYGIAVIDTQLQGCFYRSREFTSVSALAMNENASYLLIHETGSPLVLLDIVNKTVTEWGNESLQQTAECAGLPYLVSDPRGEYAAMACEDGYVRVFRFTTGQEICTIPLQVKRYCFIGFTKDSKHVILQGDDFRVRIYRVSDGACRNSFEAPAPVSYMVEDGERIALCDNYKLNLIDAETFGRLAFVPDGITYLAAEKTFVIVDGTRAWTTKYKDYTELLAEAERQFPGAKLSEEKRMAYHVEE